MAEEDEATRSLRTGFLSLRKVFNDVSGSHELRLLSLELDLRSTKVRLQQERDARQALESTVQLLTDRLAALEAQSSVESKRTRASAIHAQDEMSRDSDVRDSEDQVARLYEKFIALKQRVEVATRQDESKLDQEMDEGERELQQLLRDWEGPSSTSVTSPPQTAIAVSHSRPATVPQLVNTPSPARPPVLHSPTSRTPSSLSSVSTLSSPVTASSVALSSSTRPTAVLSSSSHAVTTPPAGTRTRRSRAPASPALLTHLGLDLSVPPPTCAAASRLFVALRDAAHIPDNQLNELYHIEPSPAGWVCSIRFQGREWAQCVAANKREAKEAACEQALRKLTVDRQWGQYFRLSIPKPDVLSATASLGNFIKDRSEYGGELSEEYTSLGDGLGFECAVSFRNAIIGIGTGGTKVSARESASRDALVLLGECRDLLIEQEATRSAST